MRTIIFIFIQLMLLQTVHAAVTMAGTRVIFPAEVADKTIQLKNNSEQPFFVQMWVSDQLENSNKNQPSDFVVNPQFFKMSGNSGQAVRLFYSSHKVLPKDRESLYYLNFKQIPALEKDKSDQNKLVLVVTSKFKILYRPKTITSKIEDLPKNLSYTISSDQVSSFITIDNPTGYYANLTQIFFDHSGKTTEVENVDMIPPFSSKKFNLGKKINKNTLSNISMTYINDYGAYLKYQIKEKP